MITCYFLQRQKEKDICLSPYLDTDKTGQWNEEDQVELKSSGMLTKEQKDEASYALYEAIDFSVDRWIQNKQYIPRLLLSALVFTVAYFFLSLVIRDPIPMVDELAISTGLTIWFWSYLAKRDTRSSLAQRRRYELKLRSGERNDVIDEQLFSIETYLDEISAEDPMELVHSLCLVSEEPLKPFSYDGPTETTRELSSLLSVYLHLYDKNLYRTALKVHNIRVQHRSDPHLAARLFHQGMQQRLDLGLLTLVVALMEI